jgi:outer membrane cobalamin receptor
MLGAATKLETGYKGTFRSLDNDYVSALYDADGVLVPGSEAPNAFVYDEDVNAGYALLTQTLGKVQVQGGARLEHAGRNFAVAGEDFPKDYTSLFPSAAVMWQLDDARQLRASYSRRIRRPDARQLNPFPFNDGQLTRFQGNPDLLPEYTDAYELTYQHSLPFGSIQLSPYYRRSEDVMRQVRQVEDGVFVGTFRNLATSEQMGTDATMSLRLGQKLNGFVNFSGYRMVTDGGEELPELRSDAFSWSARASLTYRVTPRLELQYFQMYRAPMKFEQGRMGAFSMTNLALRQKLWSDNASLAVRVSDPFNTMRFRFVTDDAEQYEESRRRFNSRAVYLAFQYSWGQQPRLRQRPQQQQPEAPATPEIGPPSGGR